MGANFSSEPVVEKHTERDQNDTFTAAVSSCQGWRLSQEDEHSLILDLPGAHKASFFAVFDGHGSGRVSKHASVGLWKHLTDNEKYINGNFKEALEESFLSFDREVSESYNAQLAGTTAVCVLIVDNVIYCANIGDSRAVASINCECVPLSQDHKPDNPLELKRILAAGGYVFGNRVNGNLALSRAFGDFHYKSNDQLPADQQIVSPKPDIKRIELNDDVDFIVLACDGIWDVLKSKEVVDFVISHLEQYTEPGLICEQLTTRCIATDYELVIGCDNMTVLLVCHTRGRSWSEYCTDIFNKHTNLLGVPRTRTFGDDTNTLQENRFLESNSTSATDQDIVDRSVIDMMREAQDNGAVSTQEDETPLITEIVAEENPTPTEEDPAPTEENQAPTEGDPAPTEEDPVPTGENQGPTEEDQAPTEGDPAPTEEDPAPTEEDPSPTEEDQAPTEGDQAPTEEDPAPTEEDPALTEENPAPTEEDPTKTEEDPAPTEEDPTQTEEGPAPTEENPATTEEDPTPTEENPTPTEETKVDNQSSCEATSTETDTSIENTNQPTD
jgi:protein phosphatase 2C family protein 2/3